MHTSKRRSFPGILCMCVCGWVRERNREKKFAIMRVFMWRVLENVTLFPVFFVCVSVWMSVRESVCACACVHVCVCTCVCILTWCMLQNVTLFPVFFVCVSVWVRARAKVSVCVFSRDACFRTSLVLWYALYVCMWVSASVGESEEQRESLCVYVYSHVMHTHKHTRAHTHTRNLQNSLMSRLEITDLMGHVKKITHANFACVCLHFDACFGTWLFSR